MRVRRLMLRGVFVGVSGLWAWVMVVVGLLAVLDWPGRLGLSPVPWLVTLAGLTFIAGGVFTFAMTLGRVLPMTVAWVRLSFEALPWVALAGCVGAWAAGGLT